MARIPAWSEIGTARRAAAAAEREYVKLVQLRYPPNAAVSWRTNRDTAAEGQVIAHGDGQRMNVRNVKTMAHYWISYADLLP